MIQKQDLKRVVQKELFTNVNEIKQFCIEEWAKTPPHQCETQIKSYRNNNFKLLFLKVDLWAVESVEILVI